jgi:archaellum component FlaF (FlaF/FlaG flagellin family)
MNNNKKNIRAASTIFILSLVLIIGIIYTNSNSEEKIQEKNNRAIEASSIYPLTEDDWAVNYRVKKHRLYVENIIPRFSFQGNAGKVPKHMDGYIAVFINGKWTMNANKSIFILKDMSQGKHKITLQLKKKDGSDYGIKKNIYVHIR